MPYYAETGHSCPDNSIIFIHSIFPFNNISVEISCPCSWCHWCNKSILILTQNVAIQESICIASMSMGTTSAINNSGNTLCLFNRAISQLFVVMLLQFFMFGKFVILFSKYPTYCIRVTPSCVVISNMQGHIFLINKSYIQNVCIIHNMYMTNSLNIREMLALV
jgi:hypothetical protein